ncbi:MAG TPA: alpha/beta hydrolase [Burkholderiaceae bacterium]|nr:alpha/beta hydrolase [Burkholderiaceae bacterium]
MADRPARPPDGRPRALTGLGDVVDALRNLGLIRVGRGARRHLAHFVADDGQRISVQVRGAGPPVVLIHGLACSHRHWSAVARRLARRFCVYAWDARGHGPCQGNTTARITLARLARDLHDLIGHFRLERVALVGHSMGALTVLQYLADFGTQRVGAITLVDQSPRIVTDDDWQLGLFGGCSAAMLAGLIAGARDNLAELVLREIEASGHRWLQRLFAADALLGRALRRWLQSMEVRPLLDLCDSLVAADFRALLLRLELPLQVVLGGRSAHYGGLALDAYYRRTVPHAWVEVYPRGGHSPHYAEPARFARDLMRFVADLHARAGPAMEQRVSEAAG